MFYKIIFIAIFLNSLNLIDSKQYNVSTSDKLATTLKKVSPGDRILLSNGVYEGKFLLLNNATEANPIYLIGSSPNTIFTNPNDDSIYLNARWWILTNFSVINSSRAILMEYASYNVLSNLTISHTQHSAIRCRKNSSNNVIENSRISHTGLADPANGEAIYIGASINKWAKNRPDRTNRITVRNNYIGPNVSSESVDIKEGCDNVIVENNFFNGTGMADENYSLTWVSVKGTKCTIQNNTGIFSVQDGFTARSVPNIYTNSGCKNKFLNNLCYNLKGKCVNLSLVSCKNDDSNNLTLSSKRKNS